MDDDNVFGFDIAMYNMMLVHVVDSQQDLPNQKRNRLLTKFLAILHILVKLAIGSQL